MCKHLLILTLPAFLVVIALRGQWEREILTNVAVQIDDVEEISLVEANGGNDYSNGALRLHFEDNTLAQYKICDAVDGGSVESWKAELLAHAIDRVFGFGRVPAAVLRVLNPFLLKVPLPENLAKLRRISQICQESRQAFYGKSGGATFCCFVRSLGAGGSKFFAKGSAMGWTKYPLVVTHDYGRKFAELQHFDMNKITQCQMEFARLLLLLWLIGDFVP